MLFQYAEKFLYCAMHSISVSQRLAIHYRKPAAARCEQLSVATNCYSIYCARKTFSYNLSLVQEMELAMIIFHFNPTVHSLKSTNIIEMLLQNNPGIRGGKWN